MLASFDVVSLFTNIPLALVISIINENFNLISQICDIPNNLFIEIVSFLFDSTYFSYNNEIYKQINGCPMGGAVSPAIAELIMNTLLYYVKDKCDFEFGFVFQYVDDLLVALPDNKIDSTLQYI